MQLLSLTDVCFNIVFCDLLQLLLQLSYPENIRIFPNLVANNFVVFTLHVHSP